MGPFMRPSGGTRCSDGVNQLKRATRLGRELQLGHSIDQDEQNEC